MSADSFGAPARDPANSPVADPEVDLFAGMKKKKKKVAAVDPADAETTAGAAPTPTGEVSRPAGQNAFGNDEEPEAAPAAAPAAEEAGVSAPADGEDLFADMKKKKKKPKKEIPADLVCYVPLFRRGEECVADQSGVRSHARRRRRSGEEEEVVQEDSVGLCQGARGDGG